MSSEDVTSNTRRRRVARSGGTPPRRRGRPHGNGNTRDSILAAAVRVFAERGLSGGRINLISRAARSNDRMIYYYFGSKEKLFIQVLEKIYRDMTAAESELQLE